MLPSAGILILLHFPKCTLHSLVCIFGKPLNFYCVFNTLRPAFKGAVFKLCIMMNTLLLWYIPMWIFKGNRGSFCPIKGMISVDSTWIWICLQAISTDEWNIQGKYLRKCLLYIFHIHWRYPECWHGSKCLICSGGQSIKVLLIFSPLQGLLWYSTNPGWSLL